MRTRIGVGVVGVTVLLLIGQAGASVRAAGDFEVTGEVDGLYPGAVKLLDARVGNPQPFTIRLTSVTARVGNASPDCPGSMLQIAGPTTTVDVPSGGTGTVPLRVAMDLNAPDGCQGVTFPLVFSATAVDTGSGRTSAGRPIPVGPGRLAFTGTDLAALVAIGAALVAGGLLVLRHSRRRRGELTT